MASQSKSTKKFHGIKKFIILMTILMAYMLFVIFKFGVQDGLAATALTWAFFVTCTPIADAGFIVDFPVRIVIGLKMIYSEIIVWGLALVFIAYGLVFYNEVFSRLEILSLFENIIKTPWPLWIIVVISAIGTFLSIYIGDQIYNLVQEYNHHHKIKKLQLKRLLLEVGVFLLVVILYFIFLNHNGISL